MHITVKSRSLRLNIRDILFYPLKNSYSLILTIILKTLKEVWFLSFHPPWIILFLSLTPRLASLISGILMHRVSIIVQGLLFFLFFIEFYVFLSDRIFNVHDFIRGFRVIGLDLHDSLVDLFHYAVLLHIIGTREPLIPETLLGSLAVHPLLLLLI